MSLTEKKINQASLFNPISDKWEVKHRLLITHLIIDFQWVVGLELCQGHFVVQQKWIVSVFRFCCRLSELIRRKLLSILSQSQEFWLWAGCPAALSACDPWHCWGGTATAPTALCCSGHFNTCIHNSRFHPFKVLGKISYAKPPFISVLLFLFPILPCIQWFFLCFLTNSQEYNATSLQWHSGWCWVLDGRLKSQAAQQVLQGHCSCGLPSHSSWKLSSMNSLSDNNCPPLIQAQRCDPHENKENQNQMVSVYINSFPKYVTLLSV